MKDAAREKSHDKRERQKFCVSNTLVYAAMCIFGTAKSKTAWPNVPISRYLVGEQDFSRLEAKPISRGCDPEARAQLRLHRELLNLVLRIVGKDSGFVVGVSDHVGLNEFLDINSVLGTKEGGDVDLGPVETAVGWDQNGDAIFVVLVDEITETRDEDQICEGGETEDVIKLLVRVPR